VSGPATPNGSRIVLVTGGGRSGKSTWAQKSAESLPGPRLFIATTVPFDDELRERVAKHREARSEHLWADTVEEPVALAEAIRAAGAYPTVLIDCLAVWMGNLMYAAQQAGHAAPTEAEVTAACGEIIAACRERSGTLLLVTNEVGMGVIPDNEMARRFRDLLGRCNQVIASAADEVVLMVSGLSLTLKGTGGASSGAAPAAGA
jgi:adenosylcobinamide kinase / adenosylcobinamide-phosphate guanylyltransferase